MKIRLSSAIVFCLVAAAVPAAARGPREQLVVSTAWLNQHLHDPNLVLLHVGEKPEYAAKHIPGARFVTLDEISAPMDHANMKPTDLMLELPAPDVLRADLANLGISDNSQIVVYYGNDWYSPSTRVMWTLQYAGLGDRTVLLDGGMRAWIRDGFSTTTEVPVARTGTLSPLKTTDVLADADFVKSNAHTTGIALVDARDQIFYDGVQPANQMNPNAPRGHIPGALSIPFATLFDDNGVLLSADKLAAIFASAGVKPGDTVVAYCHVGQQATVVVFAARTLGYNARLYDGSMNDWSVRNLPLELSIKKGGAR